ncbi:MAG: penicillin acylase family protein [Proteobacteria bacterium]|nr:penicillin acylase family protein [Pseudomonadota bacterium]
MKRSSIILSVISGFVLIVFWSIVFGLTRFFPNSKENLKRPIFKSTVSIIKDTSGVPYIESDDYRDVLRAQGLATARDRFFQMELIRRKMRGRLSEIFGNKALAIDVWHRRLGFSQVAVLALQKMTPETQEVWESYAQGVNDYLKNETLPWEIKLLGYQPEMWRAEDGLLVVLSMFEALNDPDNSEELAYNELHRQFKKSVIEFMTWDFGFLDSPLKTPPGFPFPVRVPGASEISFRTQAFIPSVKKPQDRDVYGSNAWAVAGIKTQTGKPLLAGDPHLNLTVPNIWYRSELKSKSLNVRGVSVPGIPGIVIGRNSYMAWSFTNSRADVQDFILLDTHFEPQNGLVFKGNKLELSERKETILIKDGESKIVTFWDTPFGPYIEEEVETNLKSKRILQWTALDPKALAELNPLELNRVGDLDQLWDALSRWGGPVQNILVATLDNQIAWAMVGKIPRGRPHHGKTSQPIMQGPWVGYVPWSAMPRVVNPKEGFIANGNQNMWPEVPGKEIWGHDWPSPVRGYQIKSLLSQDIKFDAEQMAKIQNDLYSPVHAWYRDRWVESVSKLSTEALKNEPLLDSSLSRVKSWDGLAALDSSIYPIMKEFRLQVQKNCVAPFVHQTARYRQEEVEDLISKDTLVKNLLDHRPINLLNPKFESWDELIVVSAKEALQELAKTPNDLVELKWGQRNLLQVQHPFSSQLPQFLVRLIDLPSRGMSGDGLVVRVNKPKNGASMRMIIDFSNEKNSKFSQPGGQSGYFLSPNYQDLFESWWLGQGVSFEMTRIESKQVITP